MIGPVDSPICPRKKKIDVEKLAWWAPPDSDAVRVPVA